MPSYCAAMFCRTGYNHTPLPEGVSLHQFPWSNPELVEMWKHVLKRRDWEPTKRSVICSLHFKPTDFKAESWDHQKARREGKNLKRRVLKLGAIPSVFPGVPNIVQRKKSPKKRRSTEKTNSDARSDVTRCLIKERLAEEEIADRIESLKELEERLKQEKSRLGETFVVYSEEKKLRCCLMQTKGKIPVVGACLTVRESLQMDSVFVQGSPVLDKEFYKGCGLDDKFCEGPGIIKTFSSILKLLDKLKSLVLSNELKISWLDSAINCLERHLGSDSEEDYTKQQKIQFLKDQLDLLDKEPNRRRYSPEIITFCILIKACSTQVC